MRLIIIREMPEPNSGKLIRYVIHAEIDSMDDYPELMEEIDRRFPATGGDDGQ